MTYCERCGGETFSSICSRFNTDQICSACEEREQAHPEYPRAKAREEAAVRAGDFNFAGIGLPDELLPQRYAVSPVLPIRVDGVEVGSVARGERVTVDMSDVAPLCGANVPWGAAERAQGYGYRCVLDRDHDGDCSATR